MSRLDKLYLLDRALHGRHVGIARDELMRKLEIGRSTLTRLVRQLRDTFNAPLIHDAERGGYSDKSPWASPGTRAGRGLKRPYGGA